MKLYTLLTETINRTWPMKYGGTGVKDSNQVVNLLKTNLVDLLYPVGSIYISTSSKSPSELFGGQWELLKDRFLFSAGDGYNIGEMGGESSHLLTTIELPEHTHTFTGSTSAASSTAGAHGHTLKGGWKSSGSGVAPNDYPSYFGSRTYVSGALLSNGAHTHSVTAAGSNSSVGGGLAHNNMPPYLVVYMWKRIEDIYITDEFDNRLTDENNNLLKI